MSKILTARLKTDLACAVRLETTSNDLTNARVIERVQANAVYEMRKALEKKMAELTRDDLTFTLEDSPYE